jgi:hypothetical protein
MCVPDVAVSALTEVVPAVGGAQRGVGHRRHGGARLVRPGDAVAIVGTGAHEVLLDE